MSTRALEAYVVLIIITALALAALVLGAVHCVRQRHNDATVNSMEQAINGVGYAKSLELSFPRKRWPFPCGNAAPPQTRFPAEVRFRNELRTK